MEAYYRGETDEYVEQYNFKGYDYVNHEDIMPYKPQHSRRFSHQVLQRKPETTDVFNHHDISIYFGQYLDIGRSDKTHDNESGLVTSENRWHKEIIQTFRGRFYHPVNQDLKIWYEFVFKPCGKTTYADHYQVNLKLKNESNERLLLVDAIWTTENSTVAGIPIAQREAMDRPVRKPDDYIHKQKPELHPYFSPVFSYTFQQEIEHGVHRPRCSRGKPAIFEGKLYIVGMDTNAFELQMEPFELYPASPKDVFSKKE